MKAQEDKAKAVKGKAKKVQAKKDDAIIEKVKKQTAIKEKIAKAPLSSSDQDYMEKFKKNWVAKHNKTLVPKTPVPAKVTPDVEKSKVAATDPCAGCDKKSSSPAASPVVPAVKTADKPKFEKDYTTESVTDIKPKVDKDAAPTVKTADKPKDIKVNPKVEEKTPVVEKDASPILKTAVKPKVEEKTPEVKKKVTPKVEKDVTPEVEKKVTPEVEKKVIPKVEKKVTPA